MGKPELVQSFCCELHDVNEMFAMADHVSEMTSEKSCKYSEYGSFEHLLFLFSVNLFLRVQHI